MKDIMTKQYKPLGSRLIFKEREKKKESTGGILLQNGTGETTTGVVVAVGPNVTAVKEGDVIYLNWVKAIKVKLDGEEHYILEEDELVAVLEDH